MRHTLLAGLLEVAERNMHFQERQALFEIGNVYLPDDKNLLPQEPTHLAILLTGQRHARDWQSGSGDEHLDFYDLKGVLLALLDGLRIEHEGVQIVPEEHSTFHPGRVAKLIVGGDDIGYFGDVHPLVRNAFELEIPLEVSVVAAELDLDRLLAYARPSHDVRPIPTQPAVYQDISLVIEKGVAAADVEKAIWQAGGNLLVGVSLFDIYTGEQIPAGKKSLAYSLTYQHAEETLTDKKVAKVHGKIEKALAHKLNAALRQ